MDLHPKQERFDSQCNRKNKISSMKTIYTAHLLFNAFVTVLCLSLEALCCIDIRASS